MGIVETWTAEDEAETICRREGQAGVIVLNRPRALNALTGGMVEAMRHALEAWRDDPEVTRVVVTGAGEKAFCAGGDIRKITEAGKDGRRDEAIAFWREEYLLNIAIKRYPKPYVALIDGIVMGGGVGVSLHGSHRVAGERYLFAMPEVGIGFFPDVGATWALPRLPGATGTWLAVSGARIRTADALALGLVTSAVPSAGMADLLESLCAGADVDEAIAALARDPGPPHHLPERDVIDACFSADSIPEILARLDAASLTSDAAAELARIIRAKSPRSLAIALRQMREGASLTFEQAMTLEFRIVSRMLDNPDFYEGVRAVVVDKDQSPRWQPASVDALDPADVASYFAPLPGGELPVGTVAGA
ncbi:MAG: enoyl-CoA hydratase/isomerase family protein [Alsobacter sp.]